MQGIQELLLLGLIWTSCAAVSIFVNGLQQKGLRTELQALRDRHDYLFSRFRGTDQLVDIIDSRLMLVEGTVHKDGMWKVEELPETEPSEIK